MKHILVLLGLFVLSNANSQQKYTLTTFVAEMLEKDFGILLLKNEVQLAQNNNNIGAAGYLPTVGVRADKNWSNNNTRQEFFSGQVNAAPSAKNNSTNAAIRLDWTFFDGFKMFATDKKLNALEEISTMQLTAEMEMKVYQASVLFYTLLQQEKLQEVYKQALDLSRARYDLIETKLKLGAATAFQEIQARLDLTADSAVYLQGEKQIQQLKADMNRFLAKAPNTPFEIDGALTINEQITVEKSQQAALNQNTNLLLAKAQLAIRDLERKEIQSFYYPQLALYGQYAFANSENQIGILNSSRSYGTGVGLTLQWNILNRLSTYTAVKNNKIQTESAQLVADQQGLEMQVELQKAFTELEWARKNYTLEKATIVETETAFRIAQNAFENGSITNLELREFQFSIVQAQSRLVQAELVLKTTELNIQLLTGDFKQALVN